MTFYRMDDDHRLTQGAETPGELFDLLDHQARHGYTSRYRTVVELLPTTEGTHIVAVIRAVCSACRGQGDHGGTDYPPTRCDRCNGTRHAPPSPEKPRSRKREAPQPPTQPDQNPTVHAPPTAPPQTPQPPNPTQHHDHKPE